MDYPVKRSERILPIPSLEPTEGQLAQMQRKFGMFVHFGVNTFGNTEWSDGMIDPMSYRPTEIDADQWVKTAYDAGLNFIVLITKHHDGFCLWNTDTTAYSVKKSGNPTDVVAKVAEACKKYGVKLGLYYSLWDRKEETYTSNFRDGYVPYMLKQLTELMDGRYGEIVELWLDGSWDKSMMDWRLDLIYDCVKRLQPMCQIGVNATIGKWSTAITGADDNYLPVKQRENDPIRMFPSDFRLWDPHVCRRDDPKIFTFEGDRYYLPFEMTICSREGFSWFYSNIYESKPVYPVDKAVEEIRTVMDSNNIAVINMPPNTQGKLVQSDIDHLMEITRKLGIARA